MTGTIPAAAQGPEPMVAAPARFSGYIAFGPTLRAAQSRDGADVRSVREGAWSTRSSTDDERFDGESATTPEVTAAEPASHPAITVLAVADVIEVDERMRDLVIESPSVGVRRVRLILPASWDEQPDATWPVLYLLHGQGGSYTDWTEDTDVARRLADEQQLDVLMVMPDADASYYSDWWNLGEGNADNAWATFHIEELPRILEADRRASDRARGGRSLDGRLRRDVVRRSLSRLLPGGSLLQWRAGSPGLRLVPRLRAVG